jgi:outer membrane receptor for ferrienterochelin and colicins
MVLKNTNQMFKRILFLGLFFSLIITAFAQPAVDYVEGSVKGINQKGEKQALPAANVYWMDTQTATITDKKGAFKLKKVNGHNQLIVSFVGYVSDTIEVKDNKFIEVSLSETLELGAVDVVYRKKSIETDFLNPIGVKKISEKELLKAACCNLSESFETNPAVDVSFTDAVTGTRQIMMLGLAGPYTQITRENMPDVRGLSAIYGLTYIPGTWIEGIQLIKGTGSVSNGYESIAGQINVELRNPQSMDKLYLNAYANEAGRLEANANMKFKVSKDWSSGLLLHASNNSIKHDKNQDGFLDKPLMEQYVLLNRWELRNEHGLHFEIGAKGTYIDNIGGQVDFDLENDEGTTNAWGMHLQTRRIEGWSKIGKVSLEKPYQSIGLQLSGAYHDQNSFFGLNNYNASQSTFYVNLLFQSILGNTNHKYKAGLSFQYDDYMEDLNLTNFDRQETVPGAFFEYTYSHLEKFNLVAGIRADYHNLFGAFITPRLHIRYAPTEKTIIRLSGGRGQRTANIISENTGLLASSREIIIQGGENDKPYGLNPEVAWNYGINFTQHFTLDYREGLISLDFYRTDFENQIVVDLDQSPQQAVFYNLDGESYSNSFQAQVDYEVVKRLDVRLAYRWYDVKTNFNGELKAKPLVAENRAFANLAYETRKYWKFDYTLNWQGNKRIPFTQSNPEEFQLATTSPDFFTMNFQVTKSWRKLFEVYAGVENLLDYKQENPILASAQPFSPYFESSLVWGPIFGRSFYVGLRYRIK